MIQITCSTFWLDNNELGLRYTCIIVLTISNIHLETFATLRESSQSIQSECVEWRIYKFEFEVLCPI